MLGGLKEMSTDSFRQKCIKDWWGKKGRGACPTHQLHE
jgi:hypothetical protein